MLMRVMITIAKKLQGRFRILKGVLTAEIQGNRQEIVEILIDPYMLESYNINQASLFQLVSNNNQLVAAGNLESERGG